MSYLYNGSQIRVSHPVHSISVNKQSVAFADKQGRQNTKFANAIEAKQFVKWLVNA
ncbi:hypothetical protein [Paraglaciecola sp. L1A13]|jgi:hypothetical protein|uniref:hypothetical protein n=1 Tax=Paraglaciecola sp. L1A13 TaxID=2686359 RepID=UPI0018EF1470|nr:hypothetical protein [Paraglaciecola sp. L1A13]|tara:strand:- start:41 stop:208 length:168 start_codon:yes stop_codon:yes gene_type:complete